ncbi:imidazolonepropionase [Geopsychrobacter electrodiphilus]|uniref:imidazolonepropionase n=1 Tax=Geopsychrobacter electrodiphilus TaxID=225196 RepID=UPI000381E261|nr:imidazolonepropionase [Geopsychrobacter electrodiphilus]
MSENWQQCEQIWINARVATMDPQIPGPYGIIEDAAVGVRQGRIQALGPMTQAELERLPGRQIDVQGRWLTPGLIDSHTHLVYGGERSNEFSRRLAGDSYAAIASAGGGILATVAATRALSQQQLTDLARPRLAALCAEGVTTVEIKSGYGLNLPDELKMLRAARALGKELPVRIRTTLLAAHAVPPEYRERPDDYVSLICDELLPQAVAEGLAEALDVFCETIAFTPAQTERLLQAAQAHGLGIKLHAEQLTNSGASALGARYGAWSVDHLEHLDAAGVTALKQAGTVATLLPGAFYFLRETQLPPVALLRAQQVPMALATDLNPGSSPLASLRLMLNMGAVLFGLSPVEALTGVTRHAARALGLGDKLGMLATGYQADMLLWNFEHPDQLTAEVGTFAPQQRIFNGEVCHV